MATKKNGAFTHLATTIMKTTCTVMTRTPAKKKAGADSTSSSRRLAACESLRGSDATALGEAVSRGVAFSVGVAVEIASVGVDVAPVVAVGVDWEVAVGDAVAVAVRPRRDRHAAAVLPAAVGVVPRPILRLVDAAAVDIFDLAGAGRLDPQVSVEEVS